jgi:cation-transporting ATPase 13A1
LFASACPEENEIEWSCIDEKVVCTTKNVDDLAALSKKSMLVINGGFLDKVILFESTAPQIIRQIHIFSRTSPTQKGIIVGALNSLGHKTLMCGDGTNDVGSLKRADVGLAIVNNKQPSKEDKKKKKAMSPWVNKELLKGKSWAEQ